MNKVPKRPHPNVIRVSDGKQWDEPAAQQSVQRTALAAGLIGCVLGSGFSLAIYTLLFGCR